MRFGREREDNYGGKKYDEREDNYDRYCGVDTDMDGIPDNNEGKVMKVRNMTRERIIMTGTVV